MAYNSEATISTTLESVAAQCYPDLEYIIIDGASRDATLARVAQYPGLVKKLVSEPDRGIYDAMNKGVRYATGDVIGILNSDDYYVDSNVLNEVAVAFASDPSLEVVLGDVDFVADGDLEKPVRSYRAGAFKPWMFRLGLMPPHPAVFVRKSAYDRVGYYKTEYKIAADFDFLVRLLLIDGAHYKSTKKHWVRMRTGGASTSGWRSNVVSTKEMHRALNENGIFSSNLMLLLRLPIKLIRQVFV